MRAPIKLLHEGVFLMGKQRPRALRPDGEVFLMGKPRLSLAK